MSFDASTLRKLAALNLSSEQMAGVVDILADMQEAEEARKLAQRERARKSRASRDRNATVTRRDRDVPRAGVTRVEDKTSNLDIEPQEQKERNALTREFALFWTEFPNKVGKPKAAAAWPTARRRAEFAVIMDGLRRYLASKPADRPWLNPATFLNQQRWNDEPAAVAPMARGSPQQQAPSMSQLLQVIRDHPNENEPEPSEDRSSLRQAIPYLRTAGAG